MNTRHIIAGLCALAVTACVAHAQSPASGADAVERFTPGSGAGYGMDHYPANVLGLPDTTSRTDVATVDPEQILALGLGGEIVLRFDAAPITDGPGPDFVVFENAFRYTIGERMRTYAEPGQVAVSRDGVEFIAFPFDSLTLAGCAGVTPVRGDRDPADPAVSGGDAFDLAALGIDSVRYVRIRDVTMVVKGNTSHPFWDPTLSGFDLDAVVAARHASSSVAGERAANTASLAPNPVAGTAMLRLDLTEAAHVRAVIVDALGRPCRVLVDETLGAGAQRIVVDATGMANGLYFVALTTGHAPVLLMRMAVVH